MTIFVFVEGNIGAGKSSVLRAVDELRLPGVLVVPEPIERWTEPMHDAHGASALQLFYQDPAKHAMAFQLHVLGTKLDDLLDHIGGLPLEGDADATQTVVLCERDPFGPSVFAEANVAEGTFSGFDMAAYTGLCRTVARSNVLLERASRTAATLYIRTEPGECCRRMARRGRVSEAEVEPERLQRLHMLHDRMIAGKEEAASRDPDAMGVRVVDGAGDVASMAEDVRTFIDDLRRRCSSRGGGSPAG